MMINSVVDVEREMYALVCDVPDRISDDEILQALESVIDTKRGRR